LLSAALLLIDSRNQEIEELRYLLWAAETEVASIHEAAARVAAEAEKEVVEPTLAFTNQPLYMSEEQEDVQWQLDNDLISAKTAQALLKDLEFENAEVHLADEYSYENFHY
jgi:hypothetical protein